MTRRIFQVLRATLVATAVATATIAVPPTPFAHATDEREADIDFRGDFTYTIDPASGVVHVRASMYLAHDNRAMYYSPRPSIAYVLFNVPSNAVNFNASQYGPVPGWQAIPDEDIGVTALKYLPLGGIGDYMRLEIDLHGSLNYTYHMQLVIEYDIPGLPARSIGATRVNDAYVGFEAYTIGDSGMGSITVVTPSGYLVDTLDSDWSRTTTNGTTTYRLDQVIDANQRSWYVAAHNKSNLVDATASVADADFRIRAWPGDSEWSPFVTDTLTDGLPILERLTGQSWPIETTVDITESYTPYAFGYAGWYSASDNTIELGERLDEDVVLHEVSHAWFNSKWFADRWLSEGFAQVYSTLAATELGAAPEVIEPAAVDTAAAGHVLLDDWDSVAADDSDGAREDYGYNASWSVVQQITDDIGLDAMVEVLADIADQVPTYPGDAPDERSYALTDSRRFLDLVERHGASIDTSDLFEALVLTPADAEMLDDRAEARTAYAELELVADEWAPPRTIRDDMANWKFESARSDIDQALHIIDLRDQLDEIALEAGFTFSSELETMFENAHTNLNQVQASIESTLASAQRLLAAVRAERSSHGIFGTVGLIGSDLSAVLDDARSAIETGDLAAVDRHAKDVADEVDSSTTDGLVRVAIVVVLAGALVLVVLLRRRRALLGDGLELDEDALAGAGDGGVDDALLVAGLDDGEAAASTGIVEGDAPVDDVGDAVL